MIGENHKKKGYKQTDVGVIPEDWNVKLLGQIGTFKKGKGIKKDSVVTDGLPCIRYGEIYTYHNDYIKQFNSHINSETAKESQKLKQGDLLFAGSGETAEEIGKCVAFLDDKEVYAGGDIIILSPNEHNSLYLGFLMNHKIIVKQKSQMGQGDAVVHIYSSSLTNVKVPLPPLPEQQAIAEVLSDADALITSLDGLITKKRNIKQGAMQLLLTGKKRLPGFSGDWETKQFGEIAYLSKNFINPIYANISFPCVELEHLSQETGRLLGFIESENQLSHKAKFSKGDVLFGKLRPYLKKFLFPQFDGVCSTEIWVIKSFGNILNELVFYLVQSDRFIEAANQTSGTKMPRAEWKTIKETEFEIPPTKEEQKAIAQILSEMDAEIEALETRQAKYKAVKQGMMQELLTGKTRLPVKQEI